MSEPTENSGRRRLIIAGLVGASAGLFLLVAFLGKRRVPPLAPRDSAHALSLPEHSAEACMACHARGTPLDRPRGHTGRQDCWDCHSLAPR